ncbi:MAG: PEP-CTERM sorting domain-containing protein [Gammaproteobacteria bacterium]|nr:PEP-CTERM sorting domain-containing protein [Gammaproteobacteria bacterium]
MTKMTWLSSIAAAAVVGSALAVPASATAINWDFFALAGGTNQTLGGNYLFTNPLAPKQSIVAFALVPNLAGTWTSNACNDTANGPCLYAKGAGTLPGNPERGLGLIPNSQYEIFSPNGIGLVASAPILSVSIGSVQSGESWQLQGCIFNNTPCTTIDQGVGGGSNGVITLSNLGHYDGYVVDVPCANSTTCASTSTNSSNNILLMSVTTSVPEPATWALLAAGLAGVGLMLRRRRPSA